MASPTAVGGAGLGGSLAGGLVSGIGSIFAGESQKKMYDYQAAVANINSQTDLQNADYARNVGEIQAGIAGRKGAQTEGQIKTAQAAGGIDVNSGSNKMVQDSQHLLDVTDQTQLRSNAAKTAYNFDVQSQNDKNQAGLYTTAGQNAQTAGFIKAAGSIIGTAGSVSSKWMQGQSAGLWAGNSSVALYGPDQNITGYAS